jgi:hypothetical protein
MSLPSKRPADPRTRLLAELPDGGAGDHGTFSRPESSNSSIRSGGRPPTLPTPSWIKRAVTTTERAEEAGVKRPWLMYLSYYIPCIAWVQQYKMQYLVGDVAAGSKLSLLPLPEAVSADTAHKSRWRAFISRWLCRSRRT